MQTAERQHATFQENRMQFFPRPTTTCEIANDSWAQHALFRQKWTQSVSHSCLCLSLCYPSPEKVPRCEQVKTSVSKNDSGFLIPETFKLVFSCSLSSRSCGRVRLYHQARHFIRRHLLSHSLTSLVRIEDVARCPELHRPNRSPIRDVQSNAALSVPRRIRCCVVSSTVCFVQRRWADRFCRCHP